MYEKAWEFQELVNDLQKVINQEVIIIQETAQNALTLSTNQTLRQYLEFITDVKEMDGKVRNRLAEVDTEDECFQLLKENLDFTTNTSAHQTILCASVYDNLVQTLIQQTKDSIYEITNFTFDVQQVVVRLFININAYVHAPEMAEELENIYKIATGKWNESKEKNNLMIDKFGLSIKAANSNLGHCHADMVEFMIPSYSNLTIGIRECQSLQQNAPDAFKLPEFLVQYIENFPVFTFGGKRMSRNGKRRTG